jgi:hypothetical protein
LALRVARAASCIRHDAYGGNLSIEAIDRQPRMPPVSDDPGALCSGRHTEGQEVFRECRKHVIYSGHQQVLATAIT